MRVQKRIITVIAMAAAMLFGPQAGAAENDLQATVDYLNWDRSVEAFGGLLKSEFTTSEDHRQIDQMVKELSDKSGKWIWRWEMKGQDSVALRVNGQVQAWLSDINAQERSFKVNGQPVKVKNGESFLSYRKQIEKAIQAKVATLDQLFFSEAHAFPWLAAFAIGGIAVAGAASARPQCPIPPHPIASSSPSRQTFKGGQVCRQMPRNYERRIREVKKASWRYRPVNDNHHYDEVCVEGYMRGGMGRPGAVGICKCIWRKMNPNCTIGWNMTFPMAQATCEVALGTACNVVVPAPVPPGGGFTPAYPGKGPQDVPGFTPEYPGKPVDPAPTGYTCFDSQGRQTPCPPAGTAQ